MSVTPVPIIPELEMPPELPIIETVPAVQQVVYVQMPTVQHFVPAKHAHSLIWWLLLGWWWCTLKFTCRVILWLVFWPLGLWRSVVNHDKKKQARIRRGGYI